jgi:RNA polymerase sigma-70 factor (ECF subfamily)
MSAASAFIRVHFHPLWAAAGMGICPGKRPHPFRRWCVCIGEIRMQDVCSEAEMIALISAAQHGDPKAYDQIYNLYSDKLFRYLYPRLGEREAAEDLMAEAFVRLIRMLPRYRINSARPVAAFSAWLYRIAANLLTDHYRRQRFRRHADLADQAQLVADGPSPHQRAETDEAVTDVWAAVSQLGAEQQTVILYRFAEQCSLAEAADLMGKSMGAVKALQHRALTNLRRLLTPRTDLL